MEQKNDLLIRLAIIEKDLSQINYTVNSAQSISLRILSLSQDVARYLNEQGMFGSWQKHHLIHAINAILNWGWFYCATNDLKLAMTNDKVSLDIKYEDEVVKLTFEQFMQHMNMFIIRLNQV